MRKFIILLPLIIASFLTKGQSNTNIIESNNRFAFDVYHKLYNTGNNLIFSPASITSAIAMTAVGAKDNTYNEIRSVFYFPHNKTELSTSYFTVFGNQKEQSKYIKLYNANSLWIQKTLELSNDFLDVNREFFNSSLYYTDFFNNPEKSTNDINSWVSKHTNSRIKDLIKPSVIDKATRLVLVNALYFQGAWNEPFNEKQNTKDQFQIGKRDFITTTFMNKTMSVWYYSDKCLQIVEIPYQDNNYSLMIIIPKSYKIYKKVEKLISYDFYKYYIDHKEMKGIDLSLPRFNTESEFDLNSALYDLGIKEAFTGSANFSGITTQEKLYISKVIHKANITIDEKGTEAAAATAVTMRKTSMANYSEKVVINKPFIFILRNNENNLIYFVGKIMHPEK